MKTSKVMPGATEYKTVQPHSLTWPSSLLSKQAQVVIWLPMKICLVEDWTGHIDVDVLSFMTVIFLIVNQQNSLCFLRHSIWAEFVGIHSEDRYVLNMLTKLCLWVGKAKGQTMDCGEFSKPRTSCVPFGSQPASFSLEAFDLSVSLASNLYYLLPRNICLQR